jgi:hypothetical protein
MKSFLETGWDGGILPAEGRQWNSIIPDEEEGGMNGEGGGESYFVSSPSSLKRVRSDTNDSSGSKKRCYGIESASSSPQQGSIPPLPFAFSGFEGTNAPLPPFTWNPT